MKLCSISCWPARLFRVAMVLGPCFLFCLVMVPARAQQQATWTPNFRDSDILEVIRAVQDATGKTMVVDPRVRGEITVISTTPVGAADYYSIFLRALDINGFTAVEGPGGVISIVPSQEARSAPLPLINGSADPNSYATEVFQLDNVHVNQALQVVRPLISSANAQLSAYPDANLLVMVDTAANIARVRDVLQRLDSAATPATDVIQLEFAEAGQLVNLVQELLPRPVGDGEVQAASGVQVVADRRTNSVLVSGTVRQRERVAELILRLDQPQEQNGNTRVIYLEYASAANVAEVLENVIASMSGQEREGEGEGPPREATIQADEQTNALIITADLEVVNTLEAIIQRLDIQRAQVLVEAIIVEINDDIGKNLGIQWLFRDESGGFAGSFDVGNNLQSLGNVVDGALAEDGADALASLGAGLAGAAGQTIGLGRVTGSNDLLVLIDLLQGMTGANILSTPNLLTTDNTPASITVGENVPFITGSFINTGNTGNAENPFQTINRQNVGTTLQVTPHVNRGDKVALDIVQEISSISPKAGAVDLITNERKIETRVTVADGETVVLGGLIRDDVVQNETRVPLLGDIPLVGRLFRSQSSTVKKTNLLVFIRPTILRDDMALRGATAVKYQYIRDRQLQQQDAVGGLVDSEQIPLLPEWESVLPALEAELEAIESGSPLAPASDLESGAP